MKLNISLLIEDDKLLEKYNEIQEKIKNSLKKEFDSEPVYNERSLKSKKDSVMKKPTQIFATIKY